MAGGKRKPSTASTAAAAVGRRGSALTPNLVSSTPVQPRPMRAPMGPGQEAEDAAAAEEQQSEPHHAAHDAGPHGQQPVDGRPSRRG